MFAKLQGRTGHYLLLSAAGLILFFNNLGGPSLWDLDEGRNATAALEMLESGNYVVPTFNAQLRVDKPVLLYWLQVASYRLFGIDEFAARLPSALAALATLLVCYELGRGLFCPSTALLGGLILSSTAMMVGAGRFANPDALLSFFIASAMLVFWHGYTKPRCRWFLSLGVLLGCGALTKGPVGVLLPAFVMVSFLVWERRLLVFWDRRVGLGVLGLALVALPWYIWVAVETRGIFLRGFLGDHNLSRFLHPMDNHTGSPLYYPPVLLLGIAPWSVLLVFASWYGFWSMVRKPWPRAQASWDLVRESAPPGGMPAAAASYRLLGVWLACYVLFFSVAATKLPNYLLPAAVPLALLGGRFLDRWRVGELRLPRWVMPLCLASMGATGCALGLGLAVVSGKLPFDLFPGPYVGGLQYWGFVSLVPVAAALLGYWSLRRHSTNGVVISFVAGSVLFLGPLVAWALPSWNDIKAPGPLVECSGAFDRNRDIRIGGYHLEHLPSLNFYGQREVNHQATEADALAFLRYQVPVYLFMPARLWDLLKPKAPDGCRLVADHLDMYHGSDIVVVANGTLDAR